MATDLTAWLDEREREASNEHLPRGKWHYDDGITDDKDGVIERGKGPVVETIDPKRGHTLIADPYDFDEWPRMDATGKFIAAWSPDTALRVLRALRAAKKVDAMLDHAPDCDIDMAVQPTCTCGMDELRDALDALPGAKP